MAIIVENGSIVTGANSYVTEAELTAYATARGVTLIDGTEQLLIQAMDSIESKSFIGTKSTAGQPLQWPRDGVYIDGYYIEPTTIPTQLKNAQMATAIAIDEGNDPLAVVESGIKSEKVDVLEVEYQDNAITNSYDPKIDAMLKKLLANSGSMFNPVVTRY